MTSTSMPGYPPFSHVRHVLGEPIVACPACGSEAMEPVTRDLDPKCRCKDCGRCWVCRFGGVFRVEPAQCPGCEHKPECVEIYRADVPSFWWSPTD